MHRLLELLSVARRPHHFLRLNVTHRSDLCWWDAFLAPLNHDSFFRTVRADSPQWAFFTDAADGVGCGAIWGHSWFQLKWPSSISPLWSELSTDSITFKELLPIAWGVALWGPQWKDSTVTVYCDNQSTVAIVNSGYSKIPRLMHVLQKNFFIRARFNIDLIALHILGTSNQLADAITCFVCTGSRSSAVSSPQPDSGTNTGSAAQLDLTHLEAVVRSLFSAGLAPSTLKAYRTGANSYIKFCQQTALTPFPAQEHTLSLYVSYLFTKDLTSQTVKSYLAAIRYMHITLDLRDPHISQMPQLEYVIKGFKRIRARRADLAS